MKPSRFHSVQFNFQRELNCTLQIKSLSYQDTPMCHFKCKTFLEYINIHQIIQTGFQSPGPPTYVSPDGLSSPLKQQYVMICSYLVNWNVDRLLHSDMHGVGMRYGHFDVLRDGDSHGVWDGDADLLHHRIVVRFGVLAVRLTFRLPFV